MMDVWVSEWVWMCAPVNETDFSLWCIPNICWALYNIQFGVLILYILSIFFFVFVQIVLTFIDLLKYSLERKQPKKEHEI